MATSIQARGNSHQLRVKHRLLPKPFFWTFPTQGEAETYRDQLMALLARGIVPQEMLAPPERGSDPILVEVVRQYLEIAPVTDSDSALLDVVVGEIPGLRLSQVTFRWVEDYVRDLKLKKNLAPGTVRKRVGALARVVDWHLRRVTSKDEQLPANPFRLMPVGYSQYTRAEAEQLAKVDKAPKVDTVRDRRLLPEEEQRVRLTLEGTKRGDRERAMGPDPDFQMLFELILDTGVRLREAYKLRPEQFDFEKGVIRVEGSKGARGAKKPRVVPLKRDLRERAKKFCKGKKGLVFPYWDGTPEGLDKTTSKLSARFGSLFDYAAVSDFTEHDLRHEATCRWFELKSPQGGWLFSEIEICRIMGWTDPKMALRYASLRGEDLADRLL